MFAFCVRRCGSGCYITVLAVHSSEVGSLLRSSSRLVITYNISAGTGALWSLCRPVGMWYDAALSRTVRKILSSLWKSVGTKGPLLVCFCPS